MSLIRCGLVAYPESLKISIEEIYLKLVTSCTITKMVYILHDKDVEENGELKKPHYHVYLEFTKQMNPITIANMFNISDKLIIRVSNWCAFVSYFVHAFDSDKYQYNISDAFTHNVDIQQCIDSCNVTNCFTDTDVVSNMINKIIDGESLRSVMFWALNYGYISDFKKYYNILKDLALHLI